MGQRHVADAEVVVELDQAELVGDRVHALDVEQHAQLALGLGPLGPFLLHRLELGDEEFHLLYQRPLRVTAPRRDQLARHVPVQNIADDFFGDRANAE